MTLRSVTVVLCLCALLSCTTPPRSNIVAPFDPTPPVLPASVLPDLAAEKAVAAGWPFPVQATVEGFDKPPNFVENLRASFLQPLAKSHFAARIALVEIRCDSAEYEDWSCVIRFRTDSPSLKLTGFAAFYHGADADPYRRARAAALAALAES